MIIDIKKFISAADKKIDFKRFAKFGAAGFINTAVDWLAFTLLREIFGIEARYAQVAAHALAILNSYIINKNWTFKNNRAPGAPPPKAHRELLKFLTVQGASLAIGYAGMLVLHDNLGVNEYISRVPIIGVTVIINYFGNKLFVFK